MQDYRPTQSHIITFVEKLYSTKMSDSTALMSSASIGACEMGE